MKTKNLLPCVLFATVFLQNSNVIAGGGEFGNPNTCATTVHDHETIATAEFPLQASNDCAGSILVDFIRTDEVCIDFDDSTKKEVTPVIKLNGRLSEGSCASKSFSQQELRLILAYNFEGQTAIEFADLSLGEGNFQIRSGTRLFEAIKKGNLDLGVMITIPNKDGLTLVLDDNAGFLILRPMQVSLSF